MPRKVEQDDVRLASHQRTLEADVHLEIESAAPRAALAARRDERRARRRAARGERRRLGGITER